MVTTMDTGQVANAAEKALDKRLAADWKPELRERLDGGRGKKVKLSVSYSEALDEYMWDVEARGISWTGFESTFENAVGVACDVYADYRNGGLEDEEDA